MASPSRLVVSLHLGILSLLSAFLLFQVQPVISKFILPWFGGGPGVWTTCLLFFQVVLFAGYLYAHGLTRLPRRWQWMIHGALVLAAALTLPIAPGAKWKPSGSEDPVVSILLLLLGNVALPYFVLSSTSPLVQVWFSRGDTGRSPWRLYALSNVGSLAALLSYPFFFEPRWDVMTQTWMWSGAFVAFALLSILGAYGDWKKQPDPAAPAAGSGPEAGQGPAPSWWRRLLWLLLPAVASVLLMGATNHLCQDVAVIPFLWVVPLSLYLLTFIICFEHERWYARALWALPAMALLFLAATHKELAGLSWWHWDLTPDFRAEIALVCAAMFLGCMVCHGELARLKPDPRHLTEFYLFMSAGGALGGMFVSLAAPRLFKTYVEWPGVLLVTFVIAALALLAAAWTRRNRWLRFGFLFLAAAAAVPGVGFIAQWGFETKHRIEIVRNFYGVVSVDEDHDDDGAGWRTLFHGGTIHGYQYLSERWRNEPLSYYGNSTGIGKALLTLKGRADARVGVVGMGSGTAAAYGEKGQVYRFYDINPAMVRIAHEQFYFLADLEARGGKVEIAMGDARQSLEREEPQHFDVLLLDAFSGDSVPVHLLTREAFEVYRRHLNPDGIIAVHVSNAYLALAPMVNRVAASLDMKTTRILTDLDGFQETTDYVMVTNNEAFLRANPPETPEGKEPEAPTLWTDRRHNLFEILLMR
jgi:SAM-dependent methyltransferase